MLECEYFSAGLCTACAWIDSPYAEQLFLKTHTAKEHLHPVFNVTTPDALWLEPAVSPRWRWKSTAVMTVSGTADIPVLGLLPDDDDFGVDITACPQFPKPMEFVFAAIQNMIAAAELQPFQASTGIGELKTVAVTLTPTHEVLIRFIVRTGAALTPLRTYLSILLKPLTQQRLPARVVSMHIAGEPDVPLHGSYATFQVDDVPLQLTTTTPIPANPHVTAVFYRQARTWADAVGARSVWSLYSGAGGLGLAVARSQTGPPRPVWGIAPSADAVRAANITAHEMGYRDVARFVTGDPARLDSYDTADLVAVNATGFEGLGTLTARLYDTGPGHLLLYSDRPEHLAADLMKLNNYRPLAARLFDAYPNTPRAHTAVLLERF